MKIQNIILGGFLVLTGLTSCEMKEELWGQETNPDEVGLLNVGVAVSSLINDVPVATKADLEDVPATSPISAEGYKIELLNADGTTVKSFTYASDMEPVEVPTGDYTLYAHMDETFEDEMTEPYYGGRETISIKKGITTEATVTCKMENTKIQINYPDTFLQTFETWTILITDNNGHTVTFTHEGKDDPKPIYWKIGENVKSISINVTATTKTGDRVSDSRNILKPADSDSEYWLGNDALTITVEPGDKNPVDNPDQPAEPEDPDTDPDEPENPDPTPDPEPDPDDSSTVSGIEIKVEGIFGDKADDVAVEVPTTPSEDEDDDTTDDSEEEQKPSGDEESGSDESVSKPSISFPQKAYTLPADASKNADAVITSTAEGGIQSVKVQIIGGNDGFSSIVSGMGFTEGLELVGNTTLGPVISSIIQGLEMPQIGDTSYTFPVGGFFAILQQMGATTGDGHVFNITVTDANGETTNSLCVKVTE